jgi:hypothetical protein
VWEAGKQVGGRRGDSRRVFQRQSRSRLFSPLQVIIHMQVVDIRTRYTFKNEGKQPVDSVIVCTEPELAHHLAFFEVIA